MDKWYVLHVNTGCEDDVERVLKRDVPEIEVRVFKREMMERKRNAWPDKWQKVLRLLYPGYVFIYGELSTDTYYSIKNTPHVIRILGRTDAGGVPYPVPDYEMKRILEFVGTGETVEISEAMIKNGRIKILSGALYGLERYISKVDKRKGRVKVRFYLYDKPKEIEFCVQLKEP